MKNLITIIFGVYFYSFQSLAETTENFDSLFNDELNVYFSDVKPKVLLLLDHTGSMTNEKNGCSRTARLKTALIGNIAKVDEDTKIDSSKKTCDPKKLTSKNYGLIQVLQKWVDFAAYGFNGNGCADDRPSLNEKVIFKLFNFETDYKDQITEINNLKDAGGSSSKLYRQCGTPMTRAMLQAGKELNENFDKKGTPSCQTHHIIELGDGRPTPDKYAKVEIDEKEYNCTKTKEVEYTKACTVNSKIKSDTCEYDDDEDTRSDEGRDVACASKFLYKKGNVFQKAKLNNSRVTSDAIGFDMDTTGDSVTSHPAAIYHNMAKEGSVFAKRAYLPEEDVDDLIEGFTNSIIKRIVSSLPEKANRFSKIGFTYERNYPSKNGYAYVASFAPPKDFDNDDDDDSEDLDADDLEGNVWRGNLRKYKVFPEIDEAKNVYKKLESTDDQPLLKWDEENKYLVFNKAKKTELWIKKNKKSCDDKDKDNGKDITCGGVGLKMRRQLLDAFKKSEKEFKFKEWEVPPVYTWTENSADGFIKFSTANKDKLKDYLFINDVNDELERYINYTIGWKWNTTESIKKAKEKFKEAKNNDNKEKIKEAIAKVVRTWPLGAIIHSSPIVLRYNKEDSYIVVGSNDGKLHFIYDNQEDSDHKDNGKIKLSIIPQDLLSSLKEFYDQPNIKVNDKGMRIASIMKYGVDGEISLFHRDGSKPQNGFIDPNEKALLVFGLGRGGPAYYVMDVSKLHKNITGNSKEPLKDSTIYSINYPTRIKDENLFKKNISGLRDSWSEVTFSQTSRDGSLYGLYDVAFVGSGHQQFFDRDYDDDGEKISLPKQIRGPQVIDENDNFSCNTAVDDKDISSKSDKAKAENKKFCNGSYWDSNNQGNNGYWSKPFPGYRWDKKIEGLEQTDGSSTKYSDGTKHGITYAGENAQPTFTSMNGSCVASSSPPQPNPPYEGPVTGCSTSECAGHDVPYTCCSEYECHTCHYHVTDKWWKTCTVFDGYRYFYNTKQKEKNSDETSEEWSSTKKKFSIRLEDVVAYKINFNHLDLGEEDSLKIIDNYGRTVQSISSGSTTSNWIYGDSVNLILSTKGSTGKIKKDGDDKVKINESGKVVKPGESTSSWGSGIEIASFDVKKLKKANLGSKPEFHHSTYPSVFVFNLGKATESLPPGTAFNTIPDSNDESLFIRFTYKCPSASEKCKDKDDGKRFKDLQYMVFPISAKVSVVEKGGVFQKAFVGDEGGQIWKIGRDNDNKWHIHRIFYPYGDDPTTSTHYTDGSDGIRKIFSPIDVATADCATGNDAYALYFGTGDVQRPKMKRNQKDIIGMIITDGENETLNMDKLVDITDFKNNEKADLEIKKKKGKTKKGWYIKLDNNGKMLRGPKVFKKTAQYKVFYPSNSTDKDAQCAEVQTEEKLFAVNYCTGTGVIEEKNKSADKPTYTRSLEYSNEKNLPLGVGAELQFLRTEKNQTFLLIDSMKSPETKGKEKPLQILDWSFGE